MEPTRTEYYTVKEVANLLSVSEETVRRLIRTKVLKATELSSRKQGYRIESKDLLELINVQRKYGKQLELLSPAEASPVASVEIAAETAAQTPLQFFEQQIALCDAKIENGRAAIKKHEAEIASLTEERDLYLNAIEFFRKKSDPAGE